MNKIAAEVRAFAQENSYEVGKRGRLSAPLVHAFLATQAPARVRSLAAEAGVEVGHRGRISDDTVAALASALR